MRLGRLVLYVKDIEATAHFYEKHFGFKRCAIPGDRILELVSDKGGSALLLHQAAKGQKSGQAAVKLVFDVEEVDTFAIQCAKNGLNFGPIHRAGGYAFANAKDPSGNSISISSRAFSRPSGEYSS